MDENDYFGLEDKNSARMTMKETAFFKKPRMSEVMVSQEEEKNPH